MRQICGEHVIVVLLVVRQQHTCFVNQLSLVGRNMSLLNDIVRLGKCAYEVQMIAFESLVEHSKHYLSQGMVSQRHILRRSRKQSLKLRKKLLLTLVVSGIVWSHARKVTE